MALTRRNFLASVAGGAMLPAARRMPNIVLILADDLGYGEMGCQGNAQIPTPHIDSIARGGVRFTQGYVTAPFCCPSRAGLMTGRYQTRFGHELNAIGRLNAQPGIGLPLAERTIGDHMKDLGYATACFGKWHLGGTPPFHPQKRGFDEFFGFLHEGHFYVPPPYRGMNSRFRVSEPPYDDVNPILRGTEPAEENEYLTHAITREALSFIDRNAARPFFLYLPYNAVHSPMQSPTAYVRKFNSIADEHRQLFAGMLSALDDGVGAVLGALRKRDLEQDTLIIFLSDNGGPTAELTSSNLPLRGGKGQMYEGGIRVPFLMQWKGKIAPGQVLADPVMATDLLPTAVAAAGGRRPERVDGVDLLPLAAGRRKDPGERTLYWRMGRNAALRRGKWKLVRQSGPNAAGAAFELYDLERDPQEAANLANSHRAVLDELAREWAALDAQMVPPLWGGRAAGPAKKDR